MDEDDRELIELLKKDGKIKIKKLARKLGLPMSTVHHKVKMLEERGYIKKYSAIPDYRKLGLPISAFLMITVDQVRPQENVAADIKKLPRVEETYIITGTYDILAKVRVKDIDEMNDLVVKNLRNIKGVDKTITSIVLKEII